MNKVLIVFGTRPEAIKLVPLILQLKTNSYFESKVCVTGQHKEMMWEVLNFYGIIPDFDLEIMKENQTLFDISNNILKGIETILDNFKPKIVIVHGDTTTAFISALSAYYKKIDVVHIEAGLRTHDIFQPFPEEFNRQAISLIAKLHFSPTIHNKENLLKIGVKSKNIFVVGNTGLDTIKLNIIKDYNDKFINNGDHKRFILITLHRRETTLGKFQDIFNALADFSKKNPDLFFVYPIHLNPNIKEIALKTLSNLSNIILSGPMSVFQFHNYLARAFLVITDSGGIQEEASYLNIPALVVRDKTERTEGIHEGGIKLVSTDPKIIFYNVSKLLKSKTEYRKMIESKNPFGDGNSSNRIIKILEKNF